MTAEFKTTDELVADLNSSRDSLRRLNEVAALSHLPLDRQVHQALDIGSTAIGYQAVADRDYAVAGDWNRVAYLGENFKIAFPVNTAGAVKSEATDGDDNPLQDHGDAKVAIRPVMVEMMKNLTRFTRRPV